MSDVTLKGGDLLTGNCCEELGLQFTVGQLCVDVELKGTASGFDGIKCAGVKVTDWGGKLQNSNGKTARQSNTAHIL